MRLKPRAWFLISLLLFVAAVCMWQYADKYAAARRPVENRPSTAKTAALPSQSPPVAKAAAKAIDKHKSYRISNTTQTVAQLLHNDHAIILRNALIDTEVAVGLNIPAHLRARGAPGSYLVQADRPLDKAFYAELSKAGASFISYVPNNAALIQASPEQATNLAAKADVIVVLPYQPYYKLDGTLLPSAVEQQPQTNVLNVTTFPGQRDAALAALTQLGAKLISEDSSPFGPTLTVRVPPQSLVAVAQLPLAQEIEACTPRHLLNDLTRVRMGESTNTLIGTPTYLNLSGLNVTVNLNDTGVDSSHPDLAGRLVGDPNPSDPNTLFDYDGHGTHVAGIIAGNGSKSTTVTAFVPGSITTNGPTPHADFRGKATNAFLFLQDLGLSDTYLQTNAATNLGPTNLICNNSWGYDSTVYDLSAASYDAATRNALPNADHGGQPLLFVFAAGDGGNGSGSVNSPGTAKNVITVGNIDSPRNITNKVTYDGNLADGTEVFLGETDNSNTIAPYSGSGNVDVGVEGALGRFKPDVVAPGVFTISCRATNYVDPTNEPQITDYYFPNQTVPLNQTNSDYLVFIPDDTSQLVIVISSNVTSPIPFPTNMLLLGNTGYPPTTILSTAFSPANSYTVTNFPLGGVMSFGVAPPTNGSQLQALEVNYNLNIYLYETNDVLTNYFAVLSNLNSALKPYYMYQSGTSMSAAAVSGTLALMQEFLQQRMNIATPSPALLKAMLINGSRSLGTPYDFDVNPEAANEQGWGLPNITNCVPASLTNVTGQSMLLVDQSTNNALATDEYATFTIACADTNAFTNTMRVTLVWTDPPGDPAAGIALVNNLELTVTDSTGTNVFVGNNFLAGDIFTPVSNPTNLPAADVVNNVQNVYISPTNTRVIFPLTVMISAPHVNVNAVTTQTNDIMQDYALVISSDDRTLTAPLTITPNGILYTNVPVMTIVSNGIPLLHQRVGANEPNLYMSNGVVSLTNGYSNQWHFFVFTNNQISATNEATNVAFTTFLPPNLSIPRNEGADIDLYVYTNIPAVDPLLNFPLFVSNSIKSVGRTGTESIIISNSSAGQVYYIGVKSEDQQAADFGFYAVAQSNSFTSQNPDSTITATGITSPPVEIPDATSPQPALVFAFMVNPNPLEPFIRRATVALGVLQPNPYDLYGTVQFGGVYTVLNAYSASETNGINNTYDDLQEDPTSGDVVTDGLTDGTGGLTQYAGQNPNGLWLLTEADRAVGQNGYVTNFSVTVDLQPPQLGGFEITLCGGEWFDDYIDVPDDATNLIITATFISGTGPIGIYLTNFPYLTTTDYGSNYFAPGGSLSLSTNPPTAPWVGSPPLSGGRWFYGIYNASSSCVTLGITNYIQQSLTPNLVQSYTNNTFTLLTTDGHTQSQLCLTNYAAGDQIVSLQIGLRATDPNLDDLVFSLISPQGTSLILFENRGGTNATNLGLTQVTAITNNPGATNATTNYITNLVYTIFTENTNLTTTPIKFAPPPYADIGAISNEIIWANSFETITNGAYYTNGLFESVSNGVYTNGAILEGWIVTNNVVTILTSNGLALLTNDEVGIVTDPNGDQVITSTFTTNISAGPTTNITTNFFTNSLGSNYLALTSGHIIQTFGSTNPPFTTNTGFNIANGQPYQLTFYAKPLGITDWWPADDTGDDIIGTNNAVTTTGIFPFVTPLITYDVGEVGRAYTFRSDLTTVPISWSDVTFGTNTANFGTNDFTIDFWMKTTALTNSSPPFVPLLEKGTDFTNQVNYFGILLNGGSIYYEQSSNNPASHDFGFNSGISNLVADGVLYHHVAVTRQTTLNGAVTNAVFSMYIDGTNVNTATNNEDSIINNTNVLIAGVDTSGTNIGLTTYTGDMDELDLYNRALSPAEVYAIYHAGSLGKYSTNSLLPNFQLTIDGIATNTIILTNPSGGWQLFTNSFVATSDQVTVEFSGNAMGVLLDDIELIQEPATNYNNYYLPEEPLAPYIGQNPLGCWTLDVWDTRNDSSLPTNGALLSWTLQVTTSSTNAVLYVLATNGPLFIPATNGYTMTITNATTNGITYFAVDVPSYATIATNILTVSNVAGAGPYTLYFDQTNLPTGGLAGDVTLTNGVTAATSPAVGPSTILTTLGAPPPLQPGQRYFLGVQNTGATIGTFTITVDFNVMTNPYVTLTNTVPYTNAIIIGTNGSSTPEYYSFVVPTNAVMVTFQILNSVNGEVDLYAHDGLPLPGPLAFDYASVNTGANDQFIAVTTNSVPVPLPVASTNDVAPLSPSTWYLAAYNPVANSATNAVPRTNNYTIVATYVINGQMVIIPLTTGVPYNNTNGMPGYPTNLLYSYTKTNTNNAGVMFTVSNLTGAGNVELLADLDVFPMPQSFYIGSFNTGTTPQLIQLGTNATVTNLTGTWYLAVPNTSATTVNYSIEASDISGTNINKPLFIGASVIPASGTFSMSWTAVPGQPYEVEVSSNLINWTVVTNITTQSTVDTYTDPVPMQNQQLRFYRILEQ